MPLPAIPQPTKIPHKVLAQKTAEGTTWADVLTWITSLGDLGGYWLDANGYIHGPNIVAKPIPEAATQPTIVPRMAILHTNAALRSASSLWANIVRPGNNGEPHFQVGYAKTEQYMPVTVRADCNYSANSFRIGTKLYGGISFETQDDGALALDRTPWRDTQLPTMVGIIANLAVCFDVQCTQPAVWDASGIGHHSLFPYKGLGSKAWTNVRGKTCPGKARIAQMDYVRHEVARVLAEFSTHTGWKCAGAR